MYFSAFMSFSLLPLTAIALSFPVILGLLSLQPRKVGHLAAITATMICGGALAWVAVKAIYGYDPVARYSAAMQLHRALKGFHFDLSSLRQNAVLNSVEFVMAIGAPVILLFMISSAVSLQRIMRGAGSPREAFVCAVLCAILLLYVMGQTRGEVARLWLFLLVPVSLIAAPSVRKFFRPSIRGFMWLFSMQMLIAVLTFMNMDFI